MESIKSMLIDIQKLLDSGPDFESASNILQTIGLQGYPAEILKEVRLWNEYLPKVDEIPYTDAQRILHFLWDAIDKSPLCSAVPFAIPYRRMIAERLFKKCGKNFISEEGCRFNYGNNIEVGRDVMFNRGCYFDSKGGISFGDFSAAAEFVKIFTHTHSESIHTERTYAKVTIGAYAKIYVSATILPGVTIGEGAIVAADSLVAKDVPPNTVVAGVPAKVIRERKTEGRSREELEHYWLHKKAFQ